VFVTGGTYSVGTITFTNNTGGTFNVTGVTFSGGSSVVGDFLPLSGGTVTGSTEFTAGLSANTISATTYQNLPINADVFVTGATYSAGTSTFTNNTGGTFTVTGFYTGETSYVNSLTTGVGLSADTTTGDITIVNTDPDQVVVLNNGTNINVTGTYPNFTIDVTGLTDFNTFTTGFTYSSNTFTISDNSGNTFDATFTEVTGLTVNGDLNITGTTYSNVISATTYQNLPITTDVFVTGGTYSAGTSTFTNNTGGTFSVSGFVTGDTYVTGLTFNTGNYNLTIGRNDGVSFTDSLSILASDLTVTGGTYDPNTGEATFTNNTGGTFIVTGFLTGFTDTYVTGGTYSNGTATFTNTSGGTFNVNGFYTGATDVFVTGGTFSVGTITFTNNTGGTFNVTGVTFSGGSSVVGDFLPLSGGTVTGSTEFTAGLSANTISATTYQNLPDNVTGNYLPLSGGTVTGDTTITTNLIVSGNTGIGTTTPQTALELVSNNTSSIGNVLRFRDSDTVVSPLTTQFIGKIEFFSDENPLSGGTGVKSYIGGVQDATAKGSIIFATTGTTGSLTGTPQTLIGERMRIDSVGNVGIGTDSPTAKLHINNITTGNTILIEDSTNPDSSPFVINSGGSVSIGTTSVFSIGGAETKLNISTGSSGVATTGLSISTPVIIESTVGTSIGLFSPDVANSQIYFGTPGDVFGAFLRWDFTNKNLILSTASSGGKLVFQTGTGDEAARIDQNGNMGIGLTGATQKLEVSGNTRIYGTLSADTISATTYQNLPNSLTGLYLTTSGGTVSGNTIFTSGLTASTTTINGNLTVTGNTNVIAFTGTTGYISGSGQNILTVIGSGNSTTSPIFSVQGSSGELFSINDSLVGSLFSVNDISGLPIMEVFSDNTTLWGSYQSPSLNTTTRTSLSAGTNTIYSIPTSAYTGAFYEYTLISTGTTGARAGQIMSIWSGTSANFTETSTTDIGTTTGVTFTVAVSGSDAVLSSSATTEGWTVKTIIRSI
jgi:fibronectin-binding autotransporter adhesin